MSPRHLERSDYPHIESIPIRWSDADPYGHVNNALYYTYFDAAINGYLQRRGALDPLNGPVLQFCAESHCRFLSELTYPEVVQAGVRVEHLGRSSVRFGIGLFRAGEAKPAAEGWVVQVFLDRKTRRPTQHSDDLRAALEALQLPESG